MSRRIVDTDDLEGRRKLIARELGARAVKLNQFDSEPDQAGFEHDEAESGQEEIYFALRGSGVLRVEGEELPLEPGRYVLVEPAATRQVVAGPRVSRTSSSAPSSRPVRRRPRARYGRSARAPWS